MYDIITIGSATRDVYLQSTKFKIIKDPRFPGGQGQCFPLGEKIDVDSLQFETGGGGTNCGVSFARMGLKTAFLGRIGQDFAGSEILKILKKEGVETEFVQTDKTERTAYSVILMTPYGERTILVFRGVSMKIVLNEINFNHLRSHWFYITSLGGNFDLLEKLGKFALENHIKIAFNPGEQELEDNRLDKFLDFVNILLLNFKEASFLAGKTKVMEILDFFKNAKPEITVVTMGSKGAMAVDKKDKYQILIKPSRAIKDATGAGDSFGAGFVTGMIKKNDICFGLELGVVNSGSAIKYIGAKNGLLKHIPDKFAYQAEIIK